MKTITCLDVLAIVSITGCSSSSDSGTSGSNTGISSQGQLVTPDLSQLPPTAELPSNTALAAAGGVPDIAQAVVLIQGEWKAVDDATQCVTTFQFDGFNQFATSALDQRGSGDYSLLQEGNDVELKLSYSSDNFQSDCNGDIADSDALDSGVSYNWTLYFPDQNTMLFTNRFGSSVFESFRFTRQ